VLNQPAVGDAVDRDPRHRHPSASWLDAQQLAAMGAISGDPRDHLVILGDLVLDDMVEVAECGPKPRGVLLDRFSCRGRQRYWRRVVVDVLSGQKTVELGLRSLVDLREPLANERFVVIRRGGFVHVATLAQCLVRPLPQISGVYGLPIATDTARRMTSGLVEERTRREIIRLCNAGLDARKLRVEVLHVLRKVVPIDAAFFATLDPATLLFTDALTDAVLQDAAPHFLDNEFLEDDVNKFVALARSPNPVRTLVHATGHDLEESHRYRDILAPRALGDELRAILRTGSTCWGCLCLHREHGAPGFSATEARYVAASRRTLRLVCALRCSRASSPAQVAGVHPRSRTSDLRSRNRF